MPYLSIDASFYMVRCLGDCGKVYIHPRAVYFLLFLGRHLCTVWQIRSLGSIHSAFRPFGNQLKIATEISQEDATQRRNHTPFSGSRLAQCGVWSRYQGHWKASPLRHECSWSAKPAIHAERDCDVRTALRERTCNATGR